MRNRRCAAWQDGRGEGHCHDSFRHRIVRKLWRNARTNRLQRVGSHIELFTGRTDQLDRQPERRAEFVGQQP
jgi:hypothetical protein